MTLGMHLLAITRPLVMLLALYLPIRHAPTQGSLALFVVGAAFFMASSAVIVGWIPAPSRWVTGLLWAEMPAAALLNGVAVSLSGENPTVALFAPIYLTIFLTFERPWWRWALLLLSGLWLVSSLPFLSYSRPSAYVAFTALYGFLYLFMSAIGLLIRTLNDGQVRSQQLLAEVSASQSALERAHRQLKETAAQQQEMAVIHERQRLARDIHDSVAHSLTALVVQMQVARRMVTRSPQQAAAVLERCEEMARTALQETRHAVRALHPAGLEAHHEVEALRRLGRDYGIATQMQVLVEADEAVLNLPPDPVRTEQLYRIFAEALTNAHRHGAATQVTATLSLAEGHLQMVISNNGRPPQHLDPGVGLRSMQERVQAMEGSISLQPGAHGLRIALQIPLSQKEAVL